MAGFWAGFGEQISTNVEQRKKTLDRLIEENLDNARVAKTNYAKRKGQADQVLKSAQAIRDQYGLSDAQALAVTEAYGTDLPRLQTALDAENAKLKSNLGVSYTADDVMSYVNAAENLTLPEGMTLDQGVRRLMGLNYQELSKEADPKSEGSKTRSFIRAAFAFDPQLQAADQMQAIKGPGGLSYAQLLEMQEAGFAPEETYGDVTRAGGVTYDYTATTAKTTRTDYSRMLSTKVFNADLTDTVDFANYNAGKDTNKAQLKASVLGAGQALARLEKDIVLANRGQDLSMNAFRKGVLDAIYDRVDSAEELETLQQSVANGTAIEIIQRKGGQLTDKDIDDIIRGATDDDQEGDQPEVTAADTTSAALTPQANTSTTTAVTPESSDDITTPSVTAEADVRNIVEGLIDGETDADEEVTATPAEPQPTSLLNGKDGKIAGYGEFYDSIMAMPEDKRSSFVEASEALIKSDEVAAALGEAAEDTSDFLDSATGKVLGAGNWVLSGIHEGLANALNLFGAKDRAIEEVMAAREFRDVAKTMMTEGLTKGIEKQRAGYKDDEGNVVLLENAKAAIENSPALDRVMDILQGNFPERPEEDPMEARIRDDRRQFAADERSFPQPLDTLIYNPPERPEEDPMEARIRDDRRQFAADERSYPQPLETLVSELPKNLASALSEDSIREFVERGGTVTDARDALEQGLRDGLDAGKDKLVAYLKKLKVSEQDILKVLNSRGFVVEAADALQGAADAGVERLTERLKELNILKGDGKLTQKYAAMSRADLYEALSSGGIELRDLDGTDMMALVDRLKEVSGSKGLGARP